MLDLMWVLYPVIGVLIRENRRRFETQRWSEEGRVRMRQRSEGCWAGPGRPELPKAGRGKEDFSFQPRLWD